MTTGNISPGAASTASGRTSASATSAHTPSSTSSTTRKNISTTTDLQWSKELDILPPRPVRFPCFPFLGGGCCINVDDNNNSDSSSSSSSRNNNNEGRNDNNAFTFDDDTEPSKQNITINANNGEAATSPITLPPSPSELSVESDTKAEVEAQYVAVVPANLDSAAGTRRVLQDNSTVIIEAVATDVVYDDITEETCSNGSNLTCFDVATTITASPSTGVKPDEAAKDNEEEIQTGAFAAALAEDGLENSVILPPCEQPSSTPSAPPSLSTAGVERNQLEESNADLIECIVSIRKEKEDIEQLLQEERDTRNKLQQQMGEEQYTLIQEGENIMAELRNKLEEYESKLNQSESEAYTARQHIEEINDKRNRLEEKYLEASAQLNSSDSSKQRQEVQISTLQYELNDAKSESYALKESVVDMKEKIRRSTRDSKKAMRESEVVASELSTIRRKLSSLENLNESNQMENSRLRIKLKEYENLVLVHEEISVMKLEIEKESKSTQKSEPNNNANEIGNMKSELEQLNELMKQKDKRIKKLEAVRVTKDRLAHINKMKVDNENYEKKCSKMEKEINRLQNQISFAGTETNMSSQIGELRFDKEALEKKLRKFATHCQRLEHDKACMADALRSCNIGIDAHGSDISKAIIRLCDKFTSIEEAHKKPSNNLSHEKEKQSMQRKIEKMHKSEQKFTERLNQFRHEKAEFQKQLENAKKEPSIGDSEENREKLRFLEHENLQLMHNVKSAKRQLQAARVEVETLRMNVDQSPTVDFGSVDLRTSTKYSISSMTTSSKENSDTTELTNLAKACSENETSAVSRRYARKTKKRNGLSDNTNGTRNEERKERPTEKRRKVGGLVGTKKIYQHRINAMPTPGLG